MSALSSEAYVFTPHVRTSSRSIIRLSSYDSNDEITSSTWGQSLDGFWKVGLSWAEEHVRNVTSHKDIHLLESVLELRQDSCPPLSKKGKYKYASVR